MNSYENSTLPRLFETLENRKITAKQVSDATGIATSSLVAWRNGTRKPKYEAIQAIATYLHVPIEYLTGVKAAENTIDLKIQAEIKQLTEEQKADVLKYIEFIKSK